MNHYLFSHDQDMLVASFDKFDRTTIKNEIINHLRVNPNDTIEHCKDYTKSELKRFVGYNILNLYRINPKNNKVSIIITRGNKEYYRTIEGL
jgi:hypothetical protein